MEAVIYNVFASIKRAHTALAPAQDFASAEDLDRWRGSLDGPIEAQANPSQLSNPFVLLHWEISVTEPPNLYKIKYGCPR